MAALSCGLSVAQLRRAEAVTVSSVAASLTGQVTREGQPPSESLTVELVSSGRALHRSSVMPDGSFELSGVPAGNYEVRVVDLFETVIKSQKVSVRGPVRGVNFKLTGTEPARPTAGTVSLNSLMHPVPNAARKEFERAGKLAEKGSHQEAIQHLRNALAIYPDYAEAHNDLGVSYLRQAAYAEAVVEFQAAIKLDPSAARPLSNLAIAWVALRRYRDAEFTARRAISLDPGFASAKRALDLAIARVIILPNPPKTQALPEPRMEASSRTVPQGR